MVSGVNDKRSYIRHTKKLKIQADSHKAVSRKLKQT